jgi:transposase-like protein
VTDSLRHRFTDPTPRPFPRGVGDRRGPALRELLHGAPPHGRELEESETADDPEAALRGLKELRRKLDALERAQVTRMLAAGRSFGDVARALGISRQAAHRRYRELSPARSGRRPGPDRLVVTAQARHCLRLAWAEAVAAGARAAGSRHLLLGILQTDGDAARALRAEGVSLPEARACARAEGCAGGDEDESSRVGRVLRHAGRVALARGDGRVWPEHLLLAAIATANGGACRTLAALGTAPDAVRTRLAC